MKTKKFIIADSTSNSGKEFIYHDHSNVGDSSSAMQFDSKEEAEAYIKEHDWNDWAYVTEL